MTETSDRHAISVDAKAYGKINIYEESPGSFTGKLVEAMGAEINIGELVDSFRFALRSNCCTGRLVIRTQDGRKFLTGGWMRDPHSSDVNLFFAGKKGVSVHASTVPYSSEDWVFEVKSGPTQKPERRDKAIAKPKQEVQKPSPTKAPAVKAQSLKESLNIQPGSEELNGVVMNITDVDKAVAHAKEGNEARVCTFKVDGKAVYRISIMPGGEMCKSEPTSYLDEFRFLERHPILGRHPLNLLHALIGSARYVLMKDEEVIDAMKQHLA